METADLLARALARVNGRQDRLAAALDVSEETVSRWVNGHHEPGGASLRRLLRYVDTDCVEVGYAPAGESPAVATTTPGGDGSAGQNREGA